MKQHTDIPENNLLQYFNLPRIKLLIDKAIREFDLDFTGLRVLTEAGSNYYLLTAIIAALAGAERVYAITRDSTYGKAHEIFEATQLLANYWGVGERIKVLFSREDAEIAKANVVTNLGHVRPLDKEFLLKFAKTAVIALMCEVWEVRSQDVDLQECKRLGIPVLGTNEEHNSLKIFNYIGHLAMKMLYELHIEVFRSKIVVIGGGKFGSAAVSTLRSAGAEVILLDPNINDILTSTESKRFIKECDALVLAEHVYREQLIGKGGPISGKQIKEINPALVLVHIAGNVDEYDIREGCIAFKPESIANAGYMSVTTEYLGPRPLVDLHTAGLKIGEAMARAKLSGCNKEMAELAGLKLGFAQRVK